MVMENDGHARIRSVVALDDDQWRRPAGRSSQLLHSVTSSVKKQGWLALLAAEIGRTEMDYGRDGEMEQSLRWMMRASKDKKEKKGNDRLNRPRLPGAWYRRARRPETCSRGSFVVVSAAFFFSIE